MNERHAVRAEDVVVITESRPALVKGKGAWKRWLPQMVLRSCWGATPARQIKRRRITCKQNGTPMAGVATKSFAKLHGVGAAQVQRVRNAVAERFMELQSEGRNIKHNKQ